MNYSEQIVLFRTPYGSELYGTKTETSDTDYITIYLPSLYDTMLGKTYFMTPKHTSTASGDAKNTKDDVDERFVSIQKWAEDLWNGKQWATEILYAVFYTDNKRDYEDFYAIVQRLSTFVSSRNLLDSKAVEHLMNDATQKLFIGDTKKAYSSARLVMTHLELLTFGRLQYPMWMNKQLIELKKNGDANILNVMKVLLVANQVHPQLRVGDLASRDYYEAVFLQELRKVYAKRGFTL